MCAFFNLLLYFYPRWRSIQQGYDINDHFLTDCLFRAFFPVVVESTDPNAKDSMAWNGRWEITHLLIMNWSFYGLGVEYPTFLFWSRIGYGAGQGSRVWGRVLRACVGFF